jgi:hypothetical protein
MSLLEHHCDEGIAASLVAQIVTRIAAWSRTYEVRFTTSSGTEKPLVVFISVVDISPTIT